MHKQRVGTSSNFENPAYILYPSISICAFRKSTSRYYANVPWPWYYYQGSSGPTPDPNKILDSLSYHSAINNTRFDSSMINNYINCGCLNLQGFDEPAFNKIKVQAEMGIGYWTHPRRQAK